ncbi:MAG: hypothetical protein KDD55_01875 [Bdellovibrionales bacterium]|nr:hypothetical protein [Bdellovibrionales bacterium]
MNNDESKQKDELGLVEDPQESSGAKDHFDEQLEKTLRETEEAVLSLKEISSDPTQTHSWEEAREYVSKFRPVPGFIWRLSHFVLGRSGSIQPVSEGLVFGLRRLLFAAASDPVLGVDEKVNSVRKALKILDPDVIAAVSVVHAVCRRLHNKPHERIWRPILEDAVLRARIGIDVGAQSEAFGKGRGMLAGFAGRAGLAVLIASSDLDCARQALELLANGKSIRDVGLIVYECDPLQVSAMILSAAGCGRDAAFGTVSYASPAARTIVANDEQLRWLASFSVVENVRMNTPEAVGAEYWEVLGFEDEDEKAKLLDSAKKIIRRGHGWGWIL